MKPAETPIGLLLTQTSRKVSRAFDEALAEAGGSHTIWIILLSLVRGGALNHGELAERVGIKRPTLTHHLDGLEKRGIVTRERLPDNRRTQIVNLTETGTALFHRLRKGAQGFDARLRRTFTERELGELRRALQKMSGSV
jgi:MarR family transcriptional regulator for hemolysin